MEQEPILANKITNSLLITTLDRNGKSYTTTALYEETVSSADKATPVAHKPILVELSCEEVGTESLLGNIYVGRVRDIVKNLNAAFIEITPGVIAYYSIKDNPNPIFIKKQGQNAVSTPKISPPPYTFRQGDEQEQNAVSASKTLPPPYTLRQGDELLVQVAKEAMKTKPPELSSNLNFHGNHLLLTTGNTLLGTSKKLSQGRKTHLKSLIAPLKKAEFGLILRTSCEQAADPEILEEVSHLQERAKALLHKALYRSVYSCLMEAPPTYISQLKRLKLQGLKEVITDRQDVAEQIREYFSENDSQQKYSSDNHHMEQIREYFPENDSQPEIPLRFYEDSNYPLVKLYRLEQELEDALKEKVWLKSGAYLVIEPTEALTVIDVNTGKSMAKGQSKEHYRKVNLEAAKEVARQLRLRNLSGIILIDFISMTEKADQETLLRALRRFTSKDPVPVQVVDMTKLNLVEITRKKMKKSLKESL
ncbi:ribonuclease G [Clostridia bacterium]|nr:ribonuclease G [Clostridia bacterium]